MNYFENNDESWWMSGLNIENGTIAVTIFGNTAIEPTSEGLKKLTALMGQLGKMEAAIREKINDKAYEREVEEGLKSESENLRPDVVDNPF